MGMHKWCQDPKKKFGCPGIQQYKHTQCGESSAATKCGSYCKPATDQVCAGVLTTCSNIPKCGIEAKCDKPTGKCKCNKGFTGNGFQCKDSAGNWATSSEDQVEITIETDTKFYVYPEGSSMFNEI